MKDDALDRVLDWLSQQTGQSREQLHPDIQIERDLGCGGEDADELMRRFASEFSVDLTGFDFRHHFGSEWPELSWRGAGLLGVSAAGVIGLGTGIARLNPPTWVFLAVALVWLALMALCGHLRRSRPTPLTARDLAQAARRGRWMASDSY